MNISVILPSLNPNHQMVDVVRGLVAEGFTDIIVVNDGSNEAHLEPFRQVAEFPEVTVLTHEVNKGKGRGLKTAYEFCMANRPDIDGVVTVDGDGQHLPKDIRKCCEALSDHPDEVILGCRDFSRKDVPWKSSVGNNITKFVFRSMCRIKLSDTQTGLRVIPAKYLAFMDGIAGERFEYETRVLLEMKHNKIAFVEVPIETVYMDDNSETHFHPVKDSFKIYKVIFRYMFSNALQFLKFSLGSILSFVIDIAVFALLEWLLTDVWHIDGAVNEKAWYGMILVALLGSSKHMIATVGSRVTSSIFNYCYNHKIVFKDKGRHTVLKYYILCIIQMIASGWLVTLFINLCHADKVGLSVIVKMIVDFCLFLCSYQIQRKWVFAGKKENTDGGK